MKIIVVAVIAFFALVILPAAGIADVITFEDLSGYTLIPDGYHGLNWHYGPGSVDGSGNDISGNAEGWRALPNTYFDSAYGTTGYTLGVVSPDMVAYNRFGNPVSFSAVSGTLTFNSVYLTAAWRSDMDVLVEGLLGGSTIYSTNIPYPWPDHPSEYLFDWSGIDTVRFTPTGGTSYYPDIGDGTQLVFDNITVQTSAVPLPPSLLLLGSGLLWLGAWRRLRKS
jgi:hypothetical protein